MNKKEKLVKIKEMIEMLKLITTYIVASLD
jgi:hypothetical protein